MKPRKLLMIVNPRAGKSKSHGPLFDAAAALSQAGYLLSIHVTSAPGDAAETARREGGRYDLVVAVGGDGTLNEVVSGLVQLRRPPLLGYLPQGSTNDFASSLHISPDPAEAAAAMRRTYLEECVGRTEEVLFEQPAGKEGLFLGHAPNYAEVLVKGEDLHNQIRPVAITQTDGETLFGELKE